MYERVQIEAYKCVCDICSYSWLSIGTVPPRWCGSIKCRSRQWNGRAKHAYRAKLNLPAPRKAGRPKTITLLDMDEQF